MRDRKCRHQQAVPRKYTATHRRVFARWKIEAFPPKLNHVVKPEAHTAAIETFQRAPPLRIRSVLLRRQRLPHVVMPAQLVATVMRDVMADLPQRIGRERGQKTQATDNAIHTSRRRKAQVTVVVADDEQA